MSKTPFSDTLREAIESTGLSAYAVAQAAGLRTNAVSRWLSGERETITLATADKIAAALGIKPIHPPKKTSGKSSNTS